MIVKNENKDYTLQHYTKGESYVFIIFYKNQINRNQYRACNCSGFMYQLFQPV